MDPDPLSYIILLLGPLFFAVFTASEIALASVKQTELEKHSTTKDSRAKTVAYLIDNAPHLLLTTALMRSLGVLMTTAATVYLFASRINGLTLSLILFFIFALMAILRAFVRAKVLLRPEVYALQFATFTRMGVSALRPLTALLRRIYQSILKEHPQPLFEDILLSQDGLRLLLNTQKEENHIEEPEKQMIASILELNDTFVREVMVPRIDMVTLSVDASLTEALDVIIGGGHSRIPVYGDSIDTIVGMLYAKDLLQCFRDRQRDIHLSELLRKVHFIPASKKVNELFREMQADKVHIAIIVDEYGGTSGLVTIEDLLEEIVGEIQDEYDADEQQLAQPIKPGVYLLNSRLPVYELEALLNVEIAEKGADTVGGFIYMLSSHVPNQGETIEYSGWRFTVVSVDGHRIEQLRAERLDNLNNATVEKAKGAPSRPNSVLNYR